MSERIYYTYQVGEYYLGIKWYSNDHNTYYTPMLSFVPDVQSAFLYTDLDLAISLKKLPTNELLQNLLSKCCNFSLWDEEEEATIVRRLHCNLSYEALLETFKEEAKLVQISQFAVVIRNR